MSERVSKTASTTSTGESAGAIATATTGVAAAALTLVTAACCVSPVIAPIIVGVLGASGAVWAAGLKPYSGWILGLSFACLAYGFWTVYRPRRTCAIDDAPSRGSTMPRVAKASLWVGAVFWTSALLMRVFLS